MTTVNQHTRHPVRDSLACRGDVVDRAPVCPSCIQVLDREHPPLGFHQSAPRVERERDQSSSRESPDMAVSADIRSTASGEDLAGRANEISQERA